MFGDVGDCGGRGKCSDCLDISSTSDSEEAGLAGLPRVQHGEGIDEFRGGGLTGEMDLAHRYSGLETNDREAFLVYMSLMEFVRVMSRSLLFRKEEQSDLIESPEEPELLEGGGFAFFDSVRSCVITMNPMVYARQWSVAKGVWGQRYSLVEGQGAMELCVPGQVVHLYVIDAWARDKPHDGGNGDSLEGRRRRALTSGVIPSCRAPGISVRLNILG